MLNWSNENLLNLLNKYRDKQLCGPMTDFGYIGHVIIDHKYA